MGTYVIIAAVAAVFIVGIVRTRRRLTAGCCEPSEEGVQKIEPADTNLDNYPYRAKLHIDGMHCKNCVTKVENAFNKMDGCTADVSLSKKEARVYMKKPLPDEELTAVPAGIGYSASIESRDEI